MARDLLIFARMRLMAAYVGVGLLCAIAAAKADEKLAILIAGDNWYTNVTVTSVSATDIYFTYTGGIGNAKLKTLSPELQQHFHFNATNASAIEQSQREATAEFKRNVLAAAAAATNKFPDKLPPATFDTGDVVA